VKDLKENAYKSLSEMKDVKEEKTKIIIAFHFHER